jgi:hypothetical protein
MNSKRVSMMVLVVASLGLMLAACGGEQPRNEEIELLPPMKPEIAVPAGATQRPGGMTEVVLNPRALDRATARLDRGNVSERGGQVTCGPYGETCDTERGLACIGGACVCKEGLTRCGGHCTDTRTNPLHCGGCNFVCATDLCSNGTCAAK